MVLAAIRSPQCSDRVSMVSQPLDLPVMLTRFLRFWVATAGDHRVAVGSSFSEVKLGMYSSSISGLDITKSAVARLQAIAML